MTIADEARDNALHCEMVKYAYRQTKDGIVVSFVVHPNDIPARLSTSHIGSRFMVALVQLGDDELPIKQKEVVSHSPESRANNAPPRHDTPRSAGAKRDWRELQPAAQAGIRCAEPTFRAFLSETYNINAADETKAAEAVRTICGVHSRVELGTKHAARILWHQLDESYLAWKALEHA